jgi:hypothetical protein
MYRGDYVYAGGELIAPESAAAFVAHHFLWETYKRECRDEAKKQWGYEDLVVDHADRLYDQGFASGDDPATFIKWLGNKYDLTPASGPGTAWAGLLTRRAEGQGGCPWLEDHPADMDETMRWAAQSWLGDVGRPRLPTSIVVPGDSAKQWTVIEDWTESSRHDETFQTTLEIDQCP